MNSDPDVDDSMVRVVEKARAISMRIKPICYSHHPGKVLVEQFITISVRVLLSSDMLVNDWIHREIRRYQGWERTGINARKWSMRGWVSIYVKNMTLSPVRRDNEPVLNSKH